MPRGTRSWPLLREAARFVGYADTRRRGTVCGSLAFAASWGELTAAAVARDAVIEVRAARGERPIAARSFFRGANETALEPDELITAVRFPARASHSGASFHEASARYRDYAQVAAAAVVDVDDTGRSAAAELLLPRVAPTPYRVDAVEALSDEEALDRLLPPIEPADDIEVGAEYRRRVAPVLARRALDEAFTRARAREVA
jgi:carbon-monoxide dehydrogenase medium subunit